MRGSVAFAFTLAAFLSLSACRSTPTTTGTASRSRATVEDPLKLGVEAYTYGYPLVLMDVSRRVMTAGPEGRPNQFYHMRTFPDYTFTDVVSPNVDTLYSSAWLDLTKEPIILSVPAEGRRYYLMPILDAWTDVIASPGTRTTGDGKGDFAITGPRWRGTLPEGVKQIQSPTAMAWLLGRTEADGKADLAAVHAIQDQYRLTPLSMWGKAGAPASDPPAGAVDTTTPPVEQVARMDTVTFFNRLNALMKDNPPAAADAPALARFAAIGVAPGKNFDLRALDPEVARGVEGAARAGQESIAREAAKPHGTVVNGWDVLPPQLGNFGTDYTLRAGVALVGLGANLPADAVYPRATADAQGRPLSGANRYVIRFPKDQTPPVNGFWSLTMYNDRQFLVRNPIGRYAIGDRDKMKRDPDGSLPIYIQHDSPGKGRESNWLPAPADSFNVIMRLYWPGKTILDGTWKMPPIEKIG